jgi:uncharacterized OB-fold protein
MEKPAARPLPRLTPETARLLRSAARGELVAGACDACGRLHHPPRELCPHCWASGCREQPLSGRGIVDAFSVVHRTRAPEFAARVPYVVVHVELTEGLFILSNLVGCTPDQVHIGMPVVAEFESITEEVAVPVFRPAQ